MPLYSYSCATCGPFDLQRPMSQVGAPGTCPRCDRTGRRVFGAPALRALPPDLRGALDAQHRSADAPEVVTSLPPTTGRRRPGRVQRRATDPRQARLPRP